VLDPMAGDRGIKNLIPRETLSVALMKSENLFILYKTYSSCNGIHVEKKKGIRPNNLAEPFF
jgi:hypothetical protein